MLVRDEHCAQLAHGQLRKRKLSRYAVTAVYEVDAIPDDDRLRRRAALRLGRRSARGAEQDKPSGVLTSQSARRERQPGSRGAEKCSTGGMVRHAADCSEGPAGWG